MIDQELLQAYVERGDERAFASLVERYFPIVLAAARRQVRDAHLAEDVTQAVFIMLAKKAVRIRPSGGAVVAWLITAARLAGKAAMRSELRRKRREKRAADMTPRNAQIVNDDSSAGLGGPLPRIDERLDEALERLSDRDRTAVTLRYLHDRSIADVAQIMGTSPAAAEKRVQRAVVKLRQILLRRGVEVAPAILTGVMRQQLMAAPVPALTPATAAASALHTAHASAAAVSIAHQAMASATWLKAGAGVAAAVLLLLVAGGSVFWAYRAFASGTQSHTQRVAAATAAEATDSATPYTVIRVGVYLSLNTELTRYKGSPDHIYGRQTSIVSELRAGDLDLIPVVEPLSPRKDPVLKERLESLFPGTMPVDVTDIAALRKLDVLVACRACYPTDAALVAFESAVRGGTGLMVRQCIGGDDGGYKRESVRHLRLFSESGPDAILPIDGTTSEGTILRPHPLLGTLSTQVGKSFPMHAYGTYGALLDTATPIIEVRALASHKYQDGSPLLERPGYGAYPLVVGQLGKGRVVSVALDAGELPQALSQATEGQFSVRAVRWAAGRKVD
jgi:RNA polymerase sigma factor (sigma-70 family)